jgi:hypothetical protein
VELACKCGQVHFEGVAGHAGLRGNGELTIALGVQPKDLSGLDHADRFIGDLPVKFPRNLLINGPDSMN